MKRVFFAIATLAAACLSGCAASEQYLDLATAGGATLPYYEDFEDGDFAYAQNLYPAFQWQIVDDDGNAVLRCATLNSEETICGNPIYTLAVGDPSWVDYSLSFDFMLTDGAQIRFAPYMETNEDKSEASQTYGCANPWILTITPEGELWYETMFDRGTFHIGDLDSFAADDWNSVQLMPADTKLIMSLNGVEVGAVADLAVEASGRIGIGGTVGSMLDNISAQNLQ